MDYYGVSDKAIADELGRRCKALRLRENVTQQELANSTNLSLNTIKALESGHGKISTVIAVLRVLGALDDLDHFIAEPAGSPLHRSEGNGKERIRASGKRRKQFPKHLTS